jgi:DNA-binding transcriptional ArsR family regulator
VTRGTEHGDLFAALADPTRRRVLDLLAARGEGSASALSKQLPERAAPLPPPTQLPVSRPAVVKHLTILDRAGLVEARRQGREVLFTVRPEPLDSAARWMAGVAAEWDARLERLKRLAEEG